MHSEAATIGEIDHPVAGSTRRDPGDRQRRAIVGSETGGNVTTLASLARRHFARVAPMREAASIAAELNLVEQLSTANAPFRPTAREIINEIVGRAGLWRRGASLRRCSEFSAFPDVRVRTRFVGRFADRVFRPRAECGFVSKMAASNDDVPAGSGIGAPPRRVDHRTPCDRHDVSSWIRAQGSTVDRSAGSAGPRSFRASSAEMKRSATCRACGAPRALPAHTATASRLTIFDLRMSPSQPASRWPCDLAADRPPRAAPGRRLWFEVRPLRQLSHRCPPPVRSSSARRRATCRFRCRRMVSSLPACPRRFISRSAGRPPVPCPKR